MRIEPISSIVGEWEIMANVCTAIGDEIPAHYHGYGHMALFWRGRWLEIETGREFASVSLGKGLAESRLWVPIGQMHGFRVLELEGGYASLECIRHKSAAS